MCETNSVRAAYMRHLAAVWPDVERRLIRTLMRRGAVADVARDLVQDVAVRVLDRQVDFTDADHLLRWCNVTGLRLLIDHQRAQSRCTDPPDLTTPVVLATCELVELRLRVAAVLAGLQCLSVADRRALVSHEAADRGDRRAGNRLAARRSRARARLRQLVDGVSP